MNNFLPGIYHDLLIRVGNMIRDLSGKPHHLDIRDTFVPETIEELNRLYARIKKDIESGDFELSELHSYYLRSYNTYYGEFQLIEAYKFQVILKYTDTESYLNKKVGLIYDQIRCVQALPVVTTITNSEEYYWAYPLYNLIAVPLGEEKSFLNLPDLFHEIGHLIFKQYRADLIGEFLTKLTSYYDTQKRLVLEEDRSPDLIKIFNRLLRKWQVNWVEEFVCDMIGTYLTGAAYGWTNLKISTLGSGRDATYLPSEYHPSDEARMRGVFAILEKLKLQPDLNELNKTWNQFVSLISCSPPENYEYFFPQELIDALAENVYNGCISIGLASYIDQQEHHNKSISFYLNDAWKELRLSPENYEEWEKKAIEEIKAIINSEKHNE